MNYLKEHAAELGFKISTEYLFASRLYKRLFRSDAAILKYGILLEYEGMPSKYNPKSRHTTLGGYTADTEKYNLMAKMGFIKLSYTKASCIGITVKQDILDAIEMLKATRVVTESCHKCKESIYTPLNILIKDSNGYTCLDCEWDEIQLKKQKRKPKDKKIAENVLDTIFGSKQP